MRTNHRYAFGQVAALLALAAATGLGVMLAANPGAADEKAVSTDAATPTKPAIPEYTANDDDFHVVRPGEYTEYNQRARLIRHGKRVYAINCAGCHGDAGDGNGVAAARLQVKPRNFTLGVYKFRSTRQLELPLESDLHRTITRGLPGVSMPAFPLMPEQDRAAVIEYIKSFYPQWDAKAKERQTVYVPTAPQDLGDQQRIDRGRVVYLAMQCGRCHGMDGAGTNASIAFVEDAALGKIAPRNFTRGRFRGGDDPEDVYRTFHTGLAGAMPKFDDSLLVFANQQTVASQTAVMYPGEMEKLKSALEQFAATPGDVMQFTDAQKREVVERNSWDLVAYVLSLTRDPKPTAVHAPVQTPAAGAGGASEAAGASAPGNGEDDGY